MQRLSDLLGSAGTEPVTIRDGRLLAEEQVTASGTLAGLSLARFFALWERFERFLAAVGIALVSELSPELAVAFINARTTTGHQPSDATRHLRRAALRLLFRTWREFRLLVDEPTLDLELPARATFVWRPLSDAEVEACRWASLATLIATRQPAVWALAEAGVWPVEIPMITPSDIDISRSTVVAPGGPKVDGRTVQLTAWGATQLRRRTAGCPPHSRLVVGDDVGEASAAASVTAVLSGVMRRAGAVGPDVALRSITGWAGRQVLTTSGSIEATASALGLRNLDRTSELVGHDWWVGR